MQREVGVIPWYGLFAAVKWLEKLNIPVAEVEHTGKSPRRSPRRVGGASPTRFSLASTVVAAMNHQVNFYNKLSQITDTVVIESPHWHARLKTDGR
jgi:hypothetical protein